MHTQRTCPQCGAPLPGEGWEGLCPKCLVRVSLETPQPTAQCGMRSTTSTESSPAPQTRSPAGLPHQDRSVQAATVIDHVSEPQERYTRNYLHATGGIGRVWLARDSQLGRDVALKELRPEQADNAALCARFLKEAQITGQLEHPGIVPVYELARRVRTGQPFYTMRFVKGRTLNEAACAYHQKRA